MNTKMGGGGAQPSVATYTSSDGLGPPDPGCSQLGLWPLKPHPPASIGKQWGCLMDLRREKQPGSTHQNMWRDNLRRATETGRGLAQSHSSQVESLGMTEGLEHSCRADSQQTLNTDLLGFLCRTASPAEEKLLGAGSKWKRMEEDWSRQSGQRKREIRIKGAEGDEAGNFRTHATIFV